MKLAIAQLKSVSPYSQSRHYEVEKLAKERPDDYEARTWRERMHSTSTGYVFMPPMAFKNCLSEIAKYLHEQIPGQGKSTFTKHFVSGVLVLEGPTLPILKEDVKGEWLFVPADGKRGSGKRVKRCFPLIESWRAQVEFNILDETITEDVFRRHLVQAGQFIGVGRFRPQNNGYYGRFVVESVEWKDVELA